MAARLVRHVGGLVGVAALQYLGRRLCRSIRVERALGGRLVARAGAWPSGPVLLRVALGAGQRASASGVEGNPVRDGGTDSRLSNGDVPLRGADDRRHRLPPAGDRACARRLPRVGCGGATRRAFARPRLELDLPDPALFFAAACLALLALAVIARDEWGTRRGQTLLLSVALVGLPLHGLIRRDLRSAPAGLGSCSGSVSATIGSTHARGRNDAHRRRGGWPRTHRGLSGRSSRTVTAGSSSSAGAAIRTAAAAIGMAIGPLGESWFPFAGLLVLAIASLALVSLGMTATTTRADRLRFGGHRFGDHRWHRARSRDRIRARGTRRAGGASRRDTHCSWRQSFARRTSRSRSRLWDGLDDSLRRCFSGFLWRSRPGM